MDTLFQVESAQERRQLRSDTVCALVRVVPLSDGGISEFYP